LTSINLVVILIMSKAIKFAWGSWHRGR